MHIASWSGGKDSCLAVYLALKQGKSISHLVHFDRPNNLHGVDPKMIRLQAELMGIPLVQQKVDSKDFEQEFKKTIGAFAKSGASVEIDPSISPSSAGSLSRSTPRSSARNATARYIAPVSR